MIQVIINADDCGNNPEVNAAIDEALSLGVISSTTIMANSKFLNEVHRMVEIHPQDSFGIHLNLTEGQAFTQPEVFKKRGIIDADGCFIHGNSKRCAKPDNELREAIKAEWDAQMNHLINEEHFAISHVDGHHHCHTWEGLEGILVELMKKYGLKKARNRYHIPAVGIKENILSAISLILSRLGLTSLPLFKSRCEGIKLFKNYTNTLQNGGIITTNYFDSYKTVFDKKVLSRLPNNSIIELMCHPGIPAYNDEYEMIKGGSIKFDNNVKLISYKEL